MRQINVVLDVYSMIICMILVIYIATDGRRHERSNRLFLHMCLFNVLMMLGDITNWTCEGYGQAWYPGMLRAGTYLFYASSSPLLLAFVSYIMEYLAARVKVHRGFYHAAVGLTTAHLLLITLAQFGDWIYYFDHGNLYVRGEWFIFSQMIPFLIYLIGALLIILYRRYQHPRDFVCLSSFIILPMVAETFQIANYGIALLNPSITITLLLIFISIQSERDLLIKQQEKKLVESRVDIMVSQVQPHFLYNSLIAIRQLCDTDPKQAKQAILDFSLYLRGNMDSLKSKMPIPFERELFHVETYLALEQQRFGARLQVCYDIAVREFTLPPLTIQPIVENAVRHGVIKQDAGGTVCIRTRETGQDYQVIVEDNGVGFQRPAGNDNRSHIGIENVRERLAAMCDGTLDIVGGPGIGTTVTITIPKGSDDDDRSCSG